MTVAAALLPPTPQVAVPPSALPLQPVSTPSLPTQENNTTATSNKAMPTTTTPAAAQPKH